MASCPGPEAVKQESRCSLHRISLLVFHGGNKCSLQAWCQCPLLFAKLEALSIGLSFLLWCPAMDTLSVQCLMCSWYMDRDICLFHQFLQAFSGYSRVLLCLSEDSASCLWTGTVATVSNHPVSMYCIWDEFVTLSISGNIKMLRAACIIQTAPAQVINFIDWVSGIHSVWTKALQ